MNAGVLPIVQRPTDTSERRLVVRKTLPGIGRRISVQGCGRAGATARESSGVGSKPAAWRTGLVQHQLTCVLPSQLTCVLLSPAEVGLTRPSGVHGVRSEGTVGAVLSMMMVSTSLSDESPGACRLKE